MKKLIVKKLLAKILDKWGYKFSITKEYKLKYTIGDYWMETMYPKFYKHDNTTRIFIQSNIETHIEPKEHLHIDSKSNVGIGSIRPSAKFFQTNNNCVFKIN